MGWSTGLVEDMGIVGLALSIRYMKIDQVYQEG